MKTPVVFLDFYGTLAYGKPSYLELLQETFDRHSDFETTPEDWAKCVNWYQLCDEANGPSFKNEWNLLQDYLAPLWDRYVVRYSKTEFSKRLFAAEADPIAYPETEEFLRRLRDAGKRVYIVSNADNAFLLKAIEKFGWQFDGIVSSEDSHSYKPDSGIFKRALSVSKCSIQEVTHIGDSWHCDIVGANRMGIDAVWVNRDAHKRLPEGDGFRLGEVSTLAEIDPS